MSLNKVDALYLFVNDNILLRGGTLMSIDAFSSDFQTDHMFLNIIFFLIFVVFID